MQVLLKIARGVPLTEIGVERAVRCSMGRGCWARRYGGWPNLRLSSPKADWNRNALYRGLTMLRVQGPVSLRPFQKPQHASALHHLLPRPGVELGEQVLEVPLDGLVADLHCQCDLLV